MISVGPAGCVRRVNNLNIEIFPDAVYKLPLEKSLSSNGLVRKQSIDHYVRICALHPVFALLPLFYVLNLLFGVWYF